MAQLSLSMHAHTHLGCVLSIGALLFWPPPHPPPFSLYLQPRVPQQLILFSRRMQESSNMQVCHSAREAALCTHACFYSTSVSPSRSVCICDSVLVTDGVCKCRFWHIGICVCLSSLPSCIRTDQPGLSSASTHNPPAAERRWDCLFCLYQSGCWSCFVVSGRIASFCFLFFFWIVNRA